QFCKALVLVAVKNARGQPKTSGTMLGMTLPLICSPLLLSLPPPRKSHNKTIVGEIYQPVEHRLFIICRGYSHCLALTWSVPSIRVADDCIRRYLGVLCVHSDSVRR